VGYHIYTTDGIILKRSAFGEANILLHILTLDFGLILASARSARLATSKLRPALQEYSLVNISCIKGRNGWKITNVLEKKNFYFCNKIYQHRILSQISLVLQKMIPGESPHQEIFSTTKNAFDFLESLQDEESKNLEILLVLRILFLLGYVGDIDYARYFLMDTKKYDKEILERVEKDKNNLISLINKALKESQL
jgi:DNA repair protein RecO (recombination protein O)